MEAGLIFNYQHNSEKKFSILHKNRLDDIRHLSEIVSHIISNMDETWTMDSCLAHVEFGSLLTTVQ